MSASSEGLRGTASGVKAGGPRVALAGRLACVLGADTALGRAIAVELAGRGAEVRAVGSDARKVGETVGEIAYQGGRGRPVVSPVSAWSEGAALSIQEICPEPADLLVAVSPLATTPDPSASLHALLTAIAPGIALRGALLFATTGPFARETAPWLRQAARAAARGDRPFSLNLLALESADVDVEAAARIAALLCAPDASGLSGQLLVVASA